MINIKVSENKKFMQIFFGEESWGIVDKKLYSRYLDKIYLCSNKKQLSDLLSVIEPQIVLYYVYQLLAAKGYLKNQLRKKLRDRHFRDSLIEDVLRKCEEIGYIDDEKEIQRLIEREKRQGWGPKAIQKRLEEKTGNHVDFSFSEEEEKREIQRLLEKKFSDLSKVQAKESACRFLQRRGFSDHVIEDALFVEKQLHCW